MRKNNEHATLLTRLVFGVIFGFVIAPHYFVCYLRGFLWRVICMLSKVFGSVMLYMKGGIFLLNNARH